MDKELLHKYFKGETTEEEEKLIMDWTESSPENFNEYLKERKIWDAMLLAPIHSVSQPLLKSGRKIRFYKYTAAAVACLLIGIYSLFKIQQNPLQNISIEKITEPVLLRNNQEYIALYQKSFSLNEKTGIIKNDHKNNELSYHLKNKESKSNAHTDNNRLLVPHGALYHLTLSDGTKVFLNSESELQFPSQFSAESREVVLKGEAYFEVAHNAQSPFIVHTDVLDVQVLGTSFNVCSYDEENLTHTTLVEGAVQILQDGESILIHPNQQYAYNKTKQEKCVRYVDTETFTSWKNNEYIFRNATLNEIFSKISHWYKIQTQYDYPYLKEKRFTITIERDTPIDQIIRLINNTEEVNIERNNNHIIIKKHTTK